MCEECAKCLTDGSLAEILFMLATVAWAVWKSWQVRKTVAELNVTKQEIVAKDERIKALSNRPAPLTHVIHSSLPPGGTLQSIPVQMPSIPPLDGLPKEDELEDTQNIRSRR